MLIFTPWTCVTCSAMAVSALSALACPCFYCAFKWGRGGGGEPKLKTVLLHGSEGENTALSRSINIMGGH